jgi:hypothetical protein
MASLMALMPALAARLHDARQGLELTDGNLGAHLQTLEEAGYIKIEKSFVDRKPCTMWWPRPKAAPGSRSTSRRCVKFAVQANRYRIMKTFRLWTILLTAPLAPTCRTGLRVRPR